MALKRTVAGFLSVSGLLSVAERVRMADRAPVFMYHRILSRKERNTGYVQPGMFVSTDSFRKQISYLSRKFRIVPFEELVERVSGGKSIGGMCAITFDDGWRDNYTEAFPVLKELGVPATIFLATGFMGSNRMFWPEEICHMYGGNQTFAVPENAPYLLRRFCQEITTFEQDDREAFLEGVIALLKGYMPSERQEILAYLRTLHESTSDTRQMLNWDEIRTMHDSGLIRFGAHTVNHELLDQVALSQAREEIAASRLHIEKCLGRKVGVFAYPNGNYNNEIQDILAEHGFHAAVTTRRGYLDSKKSLMEVPRIAMHEDVSSSIPLFRSRTLMPFF